MNRPEQRIVQRLNDFLTLEESDNKENHDNHYNFSVLCLTFTSLRLLIIIWLACITHSATSQDHEWWANNVQWDGKTHWSTYIISKPAFMGPNALPIPELSLGHVPRSSSYTMEGQFHTMRGDQTFNSVLRGLYAVTPGKIALEAVWIPVEYSAVSHELKTERKTFHAFYNQRWATGDLYLQTYLQLLKEEGRKAGLMLRLGYRFPTSNMQGAARFTDAPGYYADLSSRIRLADKWHVSFMSGLYVWQTNQDDFVQNDAFLFGSGISRQMGSFNMDLHVRGYLGYLGAGDDPMAAALRCSYKKNDWEWRVGLQQGFLDFRYSSVTIGLTRVFALNDH